MTCALPFFLTLLIFLIGGTPASASLAHLQKESRFRPANLAEGASNISRIYDELGRMTSVTDAQGNTLGYTYDYEGNLLTLTYPGGKIVTYIYDAAHRLKTVTDWANRTTTYTYDTVGRLTQVDRPNNTRQRLTYDNANRMTGSFEEKMSGATVVGSLWQATYGYDNAYRLTSFTATPMDKTYAPPATTMTVDDDNQLTTYNGTTVSHDPDCNLLSAPLNGTLPGTLYWDKRNRLRTGGGITNTYDAESRRTTSTLAGQTTRYTWSRGQLDRLLVKTNPDGTLTRYIYGAGLLYEETTNASNIAQPIVTYHFDWRGGTVALSDSTGTVTARISYSPYGEETIESGKSQVLTTPFRFNGKFGVMTDTNGLLSMQARFYSPIYRRFLNEDPSGFAGGINLYAYAAGDPIDLMDPFGLGPQSVGAPGFGESLIPIWGSGRAAVNDFQNGRIGWGVINTALAITDVFLVKSAVTAGVKLLAEGGAKLAAQEAVANAAKTELTVIGHLKPPTGPGYVEVAESMGANYLKPSASWNWQKQGDFIKSVIQRGDDVLIGTPIRPGDSVLRHEIKQLIKAGYVPAEQGSKLLIKTAP